MAAAPLLLVLASALSACGPLTPPQITDVSPAPSQGGVHTSHALIVTFDSAMNEKSVEYRLYLRTRKNRRPPDCSVARAARDLSTGCHFYWPTARVMELRHPHHPWRVITTYRVAITSGIRAADGAVNSLSHSWEFSTEGGPQVSSIFPSQGGTVGPYQAISINFSRDMNPAAVRQSITLSPEPQGGYQLMSSRLVPGRFLIEPSAPLSPGGSYTLAVARSALDVDGNRLQKAVSEHFTVGPLGSSTSVVFPAGASAADFTEVLAASPPEVSGDPPSTRIIASAPAGQHYLYVWPSPDGSRIAYELGGNQPIQVLDLATGKTVSVLGSTGADGAGWSPQGQQLAFVVGGALRLYTVSNATSVTLSASLNMRGPLNWRPDGQVLAAVAEPSSDPTRVALLSPALQAVTFLPSSSSSVAAQSEPIWSPDGSTLAFAVGSGTATALWIYRPADASSPLSQVAAQAGEPLAFLNSGSVLVRQPSGSLAAVSTTTGTVTQVVGATGGQYPEQVTATAVGRQIAYTLPVGRQVQVLLANDDGTGRQSLTAFSSAGPQVAGTPYFTGS